jgi:polar amino acid transport system substrate-binding protein
LRRRAFVAGCLATVALGTGAAAEGTVVLASNEVYPLLYRENGHLTGFLYDIIVEAAQRSGLPAEIRVLPWARCVEEAKTGEIDGLFVTFRTAERELFLAFPAEPLMTQRLCFFTKRESPIRYSGRLLDLAPYRIGVANKVSCGPAFDSAVSTGALPAIERANGPESLLRMLLASRIDLFVLHDLEAIGLVRRLGLSGEIKMLAPPLDQIPGYIAFTRQRDLSHQIAGFDLGLAAMRRDGAYKRLYDAYFL